jgi:hypothetical protein
LSNDSAVPIKSHTDMAAVLKGLTDTLDLLE